MKGYIKYFQSLLFSRLNSPNSLSLSSQERCSSPWSIFVASSGPTSTAPGLSCAEGSRAGRRTPGGGLSRAGQRGRIPSLPLCPRCWGCSPGDSWPSGLRAHIAGSRWDSHPPEPTNPSWQSYSQSFHPQVCTDIVSCPVTRLLKQEKEEVGWHEIFPCVLGDK